MFFFLNGFCSSRGPTGPRRSWYQHGSRCLLHPPHCRRTPSPALREERTGGKSLWLFRMFISKLLFFVFFVLTILFFCRKVRSHTSHYGSMIPQPLLANQMAVSAHQPLNIGIAHVVWPQTTASKSAKPSQNRYAVLADLCNSECLMSLSHCRMAYFAGV